ncbi:MAG: hypothetical protein AB1384_14245 [Actinomycetota bacterium]
MDAYEFGQAVGGIVGVILVILLAVYLISKLTNRGKSKARKSGMIAKSGSRKTPAYPSSREKEKRPSMGQANVSGKDPERPMQKWI